jgi:hypothetical protein
MKKTRRILSIAILLVLLSCPLSFAAGLELVSSYPQDGDGGFEPINLMVKLEFNDNVGGEAVQTNNEKVFKVVDPTGKAVPFKVLFTPEDNTRISLLMSGDLVSNTEYKVTIGSKLQTVDGAALGADKILTFKTRDVAKDSTLSTIMMFVMVAAMVGYSTWDTKRKARKESFASGDKINPYKVAKEKKVSVEKAVETTNKQKAKAGAPVKAKAKTTTETKKAPAKKK